MQNSPEVFDPYRTCKPPSKNWFEKCVYPSSQFKQTIWIKVVTAIAKFLVLTEIEAFFGRGNRNRKVKKSKRKNRKKLSKF